MVLWPYDLTSYVTFMKCFELYFRVWLEPEDELKPLQLHMLSASAKKVKETTNKVALEHKELHTYVSKIGKAIDRVCIFYITLGSRHSFYYLLMHLLKCFVFLHWYTTVCIIARLVAQQSWAIIPDWCDCKPKNGSH